MLLLRRFLASLYDHVCEVAVEVPDTETILAAAGLLVTGAVWAVERFLPGRKRIGYRVQMDTAIGMNPQAAHDIVQLRLSWNEQEVTDATLALLRVENDGSKDIVRHDYQEPLSVEFPGRTIVGVEVTETNPTLRTILTRNGGLQPDGGRLVLPRVPLNRRDHFKLLVLLTGTGNEVTMGGFLSGGTIRRNAPRRGPRKLTLALGGVFIILMGLLCGLLIRNSGPADNPVCASGKLTIDGSTAFTEPMEVIAEDYEKQCPGADIDVRSNGSLNGLKNLNQAGQEHPDHNPPFIAMSDVPKPEGVDAYQELKTRGPISVVPLSVVVNRKSGVDNLTLDQVRDIYSGKATNWEDVGGEDLPITVVTRDSQSGTRIIFERDVLKGAQTRPLPGLSDCSTREDQPSKPGQPCEASDTKWVVETVSTVPGAIGYAESHAASNKTHVVSVRLNGHAPVLIPDRPSAYPFWASERLYTYGEPPDGSLTGKFLTFMRKDTARNALKDTRHIPCSEVRAYFMHACVS